MQITEVSIIYFIFRLLLFVVAVWNGYILSHKNRKLKISDFSPIILVYTLYSGLRWGRGVDYNVYYWVYENIKNGVSREDNEPLFELLVKISAWLGFSWQGFVAFMSFFLIFAWCFFLKDYKKHLTLALPFLCLNLTMAENLMRWCLGFSFILIGLSYLLSKEDYKRYFIFCTMGFLVHYALILNILLLQDFFSLKSLFLLFSFLSYIWEVLQSFLLIFLQIL